MKKVIIAEKPSLATAIVRAIGKFEKKDGYFENKDYIVTFAYGHLFTLYSIDDYFNREKTKWNLNELPFIPNEFKFKLMDDTGVKKQFEIIKTLVNRSDVDTIINCGDADREGEVIISLIIDSSLESKKPIKRLWLPEQTEETILNNLKSLKDSSNYINLLDEGLVRACVDWLYGINLTQLVTCKKGTLFSVGRVIIPIVELINTRDKKIEEFKPQKYYQPEIEISKGDEIIKLSLSEKFDTQEECERFICKLKNEKLLIESIESREIKKQPKKLFSLDKLQNKLSKEFKISASESLKVVQSLYEKGYVTYPRTNTEYLAEEEKEKINKIINLHSSEECKMKLKESKKIFDSSKIESHSAITPTTKIPSDLKGRELDVYKVIKNRFISNFLIEECILEETKVIFKIGDFKLNIKGSAIKQYGYLKYENDLNEKSIPRFIKDEVLKHNIIASEKLTQAPKHISLEELNNYLKNPFKKSEMTEDEEYKLMLEGVEIGTVGTRGAIIERATQLGYIIEKNGTFYIGDKGKILIESLNKLEIDMYKNKTVELSKTLKKVYKGEISKETALEFYKKDLSEMVIKAKKTELEKLKVNVEKEIIGKCPKCGKNVYEGEKSFYCEGYKDEIKCNFALFKNNNFFEQKGKKLTKTIAKNLLNKGKSSVKGFKKKDGSGTYDAIVTMEIGQYINFKLNFDRTK